jgi:hypothetical protein
MNSLLNTDSLSWSDALVRYVFEEDVASKVLRIPISRFGGNDYLPWPHNKIIMYTVRSSYHLAWREATLVFQSGRGRGMSSDQTSDANSWKALWAILTPGKMKITVWRFAHNCLPSGQQLQRQHILASPLCIHCYSEESVEHAMLFCPFAREAWTEVKSECNIKLNRRGFTTPRLRLFEFLARCSRHEVTTLAVTFWHLWNARNNLREEGGSINPVGVDMKIKAYNELITTQLTRGSTDQRHRRKVLCLLMLMHPCSLLLITSELVSLSVIMVELLWLRASTNFPT